MGDPSPQPFERWAYFVTAVTNRRAPVLARKDVAEIILSNVDFYRRKYHYKFCGYVVMPDHWHFILITSVNLITPMLRDLKSMISRQVIDEWKSTVDGRELLQQIRREDVGARNWTWSLWQAGNWKVLTERPRRIESQLDYMHLNPVRAGLVNQAMDWKWSSADWYIRLNPSRILIDTDWD